MQDQILDYGIQVCGYSIVDVVPLAIVPLQLHVPLLHDEGSWIN